MNEVLKALLERRSIRKYKTDMIPKELIDQVIEAGLYAATGHGEQASVVIAVTNKELRDEIAEENRKIEGWKEGFDPFYGAPVILIVLGNKKSANAIYDGSTTLQNMMVAAHSLGLGSCWIHRARQEFASEFGKNILKKLGVEGDFEGIGHLALGYPNCEMPKAAPRKEGRCFYIE